MDSAWAELAEDLRGPGATGLRDRNNEPCDGGAFCFGIALIFCFGLGDDFD